MAILKIQIRPKPGHINFDDFPVTLGILRYVCLDNPEITTNYGRPEGYEEFQLSPQLEGSTEVHDWNDTFPKIELSIRSPLGIVALSPRFIEKEAPVATTSVERRSGILLELTNDDIKSIKERLTLPKIEDTSPALTRSGRFFSVGSAKSTLPNHFLVACVTGEEYKEVPDEKPQKVFDSSKAANINMLTKFSFADVRLGSNGVFEFTIPLPARCSGWLWVLPGKKMTVGFVKEENPNESRAPIAILISEESIIADDCAQSKKPESQSCSSGNLSGVVPIDASEQDLLTNADVYGEDPGTYCEPFKNPNRILGEKVFSTILRVEEPAIGGLSSHYSTSKGSSASGSASTSDGFGRTPKAPGQKSILDGQLSVSPRVGAPADNITTNPIKKMLKRVFGGQPKDLNVILPSLLPNTEKSGEELFDFIKAKRGKQEEVDSQPIRGTTERLVVSASSPIDWEGDANRNQATTVGLGHILEFRLRWRSNGYSLGDVIHTLTLAPRQTKRITTIQWDRTERAARREATRARDAVRQEMTSERRYTDAVQANLREWSMGASQSSATGEAIGGAFFGGNGIFGGGYASGEAQSSSWQVGGRNIAAQEEQSLRDAVRQYGDSLRQIESSVVTEISQEEVVTGVSETLRNPNYCHALTVVYHQILRHLRVDTELAGVRECVFVPFPIRPFHSLNLQRVLRWKDVIGRRLLAPDLRWVMKYLDDLLSNFEQSQIPEGKRCDHPIQFLSGSLYLKLAFQRPPDKEDNSFDEIAWMALIPFCPIPLFEVFERLRELQSTQRDNYYQSKIAPSIAREWVNSLSLEDNDGKPLVGADLTLASAYRYNGTVRVDFTYAVPSESGLTRFKLQNLKVKATRPLVKGSIADLISASIHYETETFQRDVSSPKGTGDLLIPDTGEVDENGAIAHLKVDNWESRDLRDEIRLASSRLVNHLNEHIEYYHKCIWWDMDRDRLFMLLDGFLVPADKDHRSLASVVDRDPIAVVGNSLVFRVSAGVYLNVGTHGSPEALRSWYMRSQSPRDPLRVSLPTSGLYAKALMDKCNACEEHMGSVDWVLTDKEPELETIGAEGLQSRRAEPTETTPTPFQAPIINLQNAPAAPAPTGLGSILEAVTKSDAFRDMAGLAGTQANAAAAMQTAATLASDFGSKALDLQKSRQGTDSAAQKIHNIRRAQEDGLITEEDARSLTQDSLREMNVSPSESKLTSEQAVQNVLNRATDVPGNPIEVSRGSETVRVGSNVISASSRAITDMRMPRYFILQSVGQGGVNREDDVIRTRDRLVQLGFDWIGVDGNNRPDAEFIHVIRVFQSIVRGLQGQPGGTGRIEPKSIEERWLQVSNAPHWESLEDGSEELGFIWNPDVAEATDRFGTSWLLQTIRDAGSTYLEALGGSLSDAVAINIHELSLPHADWPNRPHQSSHGTGLNCDIRLPRNDGTADADNSRNVPASSWEDPNYDQDATRLMIQAFRSQVNIKQVLFNDPVLIREGLCRYCVRHADHIHISISPPTQGEIETEIITAPPGTVVV